ncbi:protein delta homolog 1 isoform X2 [Pseudorasbora parva]|uniref:protein delta homolog 1 isoform X2 n=1 Tax=Pseudorasbora parva TaxID=51549 RepID=UPI00351E5A43
MDAFLRLGFSALLLSCALGSTQGPECGAGCHRQHGFCEQSGECRCRSGWRGALCDRCVPSFGCAHGTCALPGQCICARGWTGLRCDRDVRRCSSKPCSGNSTCVEMEGEGHICQLKNGPCSAHSPRCQNGGTCVNGTGSDTRSSCICPVGFSGPSCELHVSKLKLKARVKAHHLLRPAPAGPRAPGSGSAPALAPLGRRSQLLCLLVLAVLTGLVVLLSSGLVFLPRCEAWLAHHRYRRLVHQHRSLRRVSTVLPEKARLSHCERLYSSI